MDRGARSAARVCIVGHLRVERDGATLTGAALGSRKARLLLALLAARDERTCSAGEIADVLWFDGLPDSATATVASLVSRLRRTVGPDSITGSRNGYRLGAAVDVDLGEAARLVAEAERRIATAPSLSATSGAAALALLAGAPLADFDDDAAWLRTVRSRHLALTRRARAVTARAHIEIGEPAAAIPLAVESLAADDLDEEATRLLMTALTACGQASAALQAFDELRRRLVDELGTDPSGATAALHTAILRGTIPQAVDRATVRLDDGVLVGREREVARLRDAWTQAVAGRGALVLITGQPGAGKTRVAAELTRLVRHTGGTVLEARCYAAERALFLQPFVEAVSADVARRPPAEIRAAASQHLDSLARLVPAIAAVLERAPAGAARADVERRRAIEAVSAFLVGLSAIAPVLVQLDDLHNAGSSSVELLHFLRTVLGSSRLLVVATVRSDEGVPALTALTPIADSVEVGPLPPDAVRRLAADAGQGHRADEIVRRTGGHALFVAEILREATGDVPATLQAAVLARAARAGGTVEAVLRAGAVFGARFDPAQAAELAGVSRAQGLAACERALQSGLLRAAGHSYEFANDLVCEVLYACTPTPTRMAHHARAMDLLAGAPEQVAVHATAVEDWPRAAHAWLVAAQDALRGFAATDGAALASRALDAAQRADDLELSGRALVLRGCAYDAQAKYADAWVDFTAAVEAAHASGDRRLEMTALREIAGNVPVALGQPPAQAEQPLRQCLQLAVTLGARPTEADVLDRLAVLAITRLDFTTALECSARALRVADAAADDSALEYALDAQKSCYAYLGEIDRLESVAARLEPINRRLGHLGMLQWTIFEASFVPLARGDYAAAAQGIEAALAVCRRSGYTPFEAFYTAHLAWVHRLRGDLDTALALGAAAVDAAREHAHSWWLSTAAALHAGSLLQLGRRDEAATLLTGIRPGVEVPGAQSYLARCLGPLAEATGSIEVLQAADTLLRTVVAPDGSAWLLGADTYLSTARAWCEHDEPDRAATLLAPFLDAARRNGWSDLVRLGEQALGRDVQPELQ